MDTGLQIFLTIVGSVLASSGLWTYMAKRLEKTDTKTKMLVGLAHDRITYLGIADSKRTVQL